MLVTDFRVKYSLYKIVLSAFQLFDTGRLHPARERAVRALNQSVDYIDAKMPNAMGLDTQKELIVYSLREIKTSGYYMEFGVFKGQTLNFMAKRYPDKEFHGFDSFEGLPEDWTGFNLGERAFSVDGRLPSVPGNVSLHKGWFSETLPVWKQKHPGKVAFIHIDCDLYSSTVDILNNLADRVQVGTIVLFDEYFNYPNWENHEYKAWQEFVTAHRVSYEYIGYARQQVAVRITGIGA